MNIETCVYGGRGCLCAGGVGWRDGGGTDSLLIVFLGRHMEHTFVSNVVIRLWLSPTQLRRGGGGGGTNRVVGD